MNEDLSFSATRESIFFRPRETGFPFFCEICINLRMICEPTNFAGINFYFFGDLSVIKARKLLDVKPTYSTRSWVERTEN